MPQPNQLSVTTPILAATNTCSRRKNRSNKQRKLRAPNRQGTQQRTRITYGSSTWHASKCKVYKLHQRYFLERKKKKKKKEKKDAPPSVAYKPSNSGTLGDTGVYRCTTKPISTQDQTHTSFFFYLETGSIYQYTPTPIYMLASLRVDYRRRFRSLLLCPLSVERR